MIKETASGFVISKKKKEQKQYFKLKTIVNKIKARLRFWMMK